MQCFYSRAPLLIFWCLGPRGDNSSWVLHVATHLANRGPARTFSGLSAEGHIYSKYLGRQWQCLFLEERADIFAANYKTFRFPESRLPPRQYHLLNNSGILMLPLWAWESRDCCKHADALATCIPCEKVLWLPSKNVSTKWQTNKQVRSNFRLFPILDDDKCLQLDMVWHINSGF